MQDETRDRLIELINDARDFRTGQELSERIADYLLANGVMALDIGVISHKKRPLITHFAGMPMDDVLDLVRAKQEGRIIAPPCKVGDTVYKVVNDKRVKRPYECKVVGCWFSEDENCNNAHLVRYVNGVFDCSFSVPFTDFGKTVFLTEEEAEQALKEREQGGC